MADREEFDPKRRIVMATFKTVLGHNLPAGAPLAIVAEPTAKGEVDEALARRLFNGRNAVYAEDHRPTPVETPEQEKARLALEAMRDAAEAPGNEITPTDDLVVWPEDTEKAGKQVTKADLLAIAEGEGVVIETDDNKPDLIRKIMERRAALAANLTNAGSAEVLDTLGGGQSGSTDPEGTGGADSGGQGDAHGSGGD